MQATDGTRRRVPAPLHHASAQRQGRVVQRRLCSVASRARCRRWWRAPPRTVQRDAVAIVVGDAQSECTGALCNGPTDAAEADDAQHAARKIVRDRHATLPPACDAQPQRGAGVSGAA